MRPRLRFVEPILREAGEPIQAEPCGRAGVPAWIEPPPSRHVPHRQNEAKPKTGHFTCYLKRTSIARNYAERLVDEYFDKGVDAVGT